MLQSEICAELAKTLPIKETKYQYARVALSLSEQATSMFRSLGRFYGVGSSLLQQGELHVQFHREIPDVFLLSTAETRFESAYEFLENCEAIPSPANLRMRLSCCRKLVYLKRDIDSKNEWANIGSWIHLQVTHALY